MTDSLPNWPEPITDRPPIADDADVYGKVQVLKGGYWMLSDWQHVAAECAPWAWQHVCHWRPKVTKEQAHEAVRYLAVSYPSNGRGAQHLANLRRFIDAAPDPLPS